MEFKHLTYLLLALFLIATPIVLSFWKHFSFYSKLKYMLPAILFSGTIFIIWNMRFEELGIWNYNPTFITGISILRTPIETFLFLLGVALFQLFTFEWVKDKFFRLNKPNIFLAVSLVLLVLFGLLAYFSRPKLYTFFTFFLLTIYFGYTIFRNRFKKYYPTFYITFLITVIPFLIIKSILISLPAVSYNNLHIIGTRIINVPVEDLGYFFLFLLMNVTIFEYLNERRFY
jgi:lycopene cyclase domain-containing protein